MGYIRIIVDSKKCVTNFDVGGGDEGSAEATVAAEELTALPL